MHMAGGGDAQGGRGDARASGASPLGTPLNGSYLQVLYPSGRKGFYLYINKTINADMILCFTDLPEYKRIPDGCDYGQNHPEKNISKDSAAEWWPDSVISKICEPGRIRNNRSGTGSVSETESDMYDLLKILYLKAYVGGGGGAGCQPIITAVHMELKKTLEI